MSRRARAPLGLAIAAALCVSGPQSATGEDRWSPRDSWWPRLSLGLLEFSGTSAGDPPMELLGESVLFAELQVDRNLSRQLTVGANIGFADLEEDRQRFRYRDLFYLGGYAVLKPDLYSSPVAPFLIANAGISDAVRGKHSGVPRGDRELFEGEPFEETNEGASSDDFRPYAGIGGGLAVKLPADLAVRMELWLRLYDVAGEYRRANVIAINLGRGL